MHNAQVAEWALKVLPHLGPEAGLQECVLEPGEVLRIDISYHHHHHYSPEFLLRLFSISIAYSPSSL
jgi:hypothetical protein